MKGCYELFKDGMSFLLEKASSFDGLAETVPVVYAPKFSTKKKPIPVSGQCDLWKFCDQVVIQYFGSDEAISVGTVIALDKKRDAKAPSVKRRRMQVTGFGEADPS
ncbi:hypothetical protein H5410_026872 [Solanum commersonii]|uniref:Uncharacterized protein n=1 Tax=Solanum commersonii TaxID=4109 RepID=A0A9J5Z1W1_SOLCO|nr:hypothetical protein H5410_026872 [Solanum commersonii]